MNNINLDLFRAGLRGKPGRPVMYYVMPHAPNNTPNQWRRLFYGAIGHGMTMVNLFEFRPVHVAYTENHVDDPAMYAMVLRSFRELGLFEDIIQNGKVRSAEAALWFSETGDIWNDNHGSFAPAKRALYTAIRHQQIPLDIVVERDAIDGTLAEYKVLYLTDAHVSQAASKKIATWVNAGGRLMATAGAGMFDELNRPNRVMRELFGVEQLSLDQPDDAQITFIKQDLPFAKPIATALIKTNRYTAQAAFLETFGVPVFGVRSRVKLAGAELYSSFDDGLPAETRRKVGKGGTGYCAFLPGLSYYKPAIPKRPVDRGGTDDAMIHFLPTAFDRHMAKLISGPFSGMEPPIVSSHPLVETMVIESKQGMVIPLVNWSGRAAKPLHIKLNLKVPLKNISLASGKAVDISKIDKGVLTFDLDVADALILR